MDSSIGIKHNTSSIVDLDLFLQENAEQIIPPTADDFTGGYAEKLYKRANRFEAWDSKGKLIGLIAAYFNKETHKIWIPYVCVSKDFQGKGIASLIFKALFKQEEQTNHLYSEIGLEVLAENTTAKILYEKMGFIAKENINGKIQMWKAI